MPTVRRKSKALKIGLAGGASPGRNGHARRPSTNGKAAKHAAPGRNGSASATAETFFPELSKTKHRFGLGVLLAVFERQGAEAELGFARVGRFYPTPGQRPKETVLGAADAGYVARMLAGLAHPDRIRILRAILQGAATHHSLHKAVKLKTGPLYHHLRALERAGVLTMATRNAYELTERGRIALLVTNSLGAVFAGKRIAWSKRRLIYRTGK